MFFEFNPLGYNDKHKKGFTLIELVIVIGILAVLASIAIPTVSTIIATANNSIDTTNAKTVEIAIKEAYGQSKTQKDKIYTSSSTIKNVLDINSLFVDCKSGKMYWNKSNNSIIVSSGDLGNNYIVLEENMEELISILF